MYSSNSVVELERDILEYGIVRTSMISIYIVTILIGILGNSLALKNVRIITPSTTSGGGATSTNTLLCSVFIVNLLILMVVVPVKMLTGLSLASTSHIIVSDGLCGFFGYFSSGTGIVLLWIHFLLGAERCLAVLRPIMYSRVCTAKAAFRCVIGGSLFVAIMSLFVPFRIRSTLVLNITSVIEPNVTYTRLICDYNRNKSNGNYGRNVVVYSICILMFLVIPIVGTIVSYVTAIAHLKVITRQQELSQSKIYGTHDVAVRWKFIVTMLVILATYAFCWTPLISFEVYRINGGDAFFPSCAFVDVCIWWHVYFICATAPYIFCGSSPSFRRSVRNLMCKRCTWMYTEAIQSVDDPREQASV